MMAQNFPYEKKERKKGRKEERKEGRKEERKEGRKKGRKEGIEVQVVGRRYLSMDTFRAKNITIGETYLK